MSSKNVTFPLLLKSFNSEDLDLVDYQVIDSAGLELACDTLRIANHTKDNVWISFDGETDHDYILAGQTLEVLTLPFINNGRFKKATMVFLRGNPSVGYIYLTSFTNKP